MPARHPNSRAYKEITLQQLRSFCETARLGSFTAAAASLRLAHPTVWKQVHILEREFGTQLVEPYVHLSLKEMRNEEIVPQVESGQADLGFTVDHGPSLDSPWLCFEACYNLDIVLITPKDHPLARRRQVQPRDLSAYPLVNAVTS